MRSAYPCKVTLLCCIGLGLLILLQDCENSGCPKTPDLRYLLDDVNNFVVTGVFELCYTANNFLSKINGYHELSVFVVSATPQRVFNFLSSIKNPGALEGCSVFVRDAFAKLGDTPGGTGRNNCFESADVPIPPPFEYPYRMLLLAFVSTIALFELFSIAEENKEDALRYAKALSKRSKSPRRPHVEPQAPNPDQSVDDNDATIPGEYIIDA